MSSLYLNPTGIYLHGWIEWLLGHMARKRLVLQETDKLSAKVAVPICIPTCTQCKVLLIYILANIWFSLSQVLAVVIHA